MNYDGIGRPLAADQFGAPSWYGGMGPLSGVDKPVAFHGNKRTVLGGQRHSMNVFSILYSFILPSALFVGVSAVLTFAMHFKQPIPTFCIVVLALLVVVLVGVIAWRQRRQSSTKERDPSWLCFLFLTMLLAWVSAVVVGSMNYSAFMEPVYVRQMLNTYIGVSPKTTRGAQVVDAGMIVFAKGTHIDIPKSIGHRKETMYCVAPITIGKSTLASYDFWAVGKDCCSGTQADFHCGAYSDPSASSGLRLLSDSDRGFYRLAVQQAEATYNITAVQPIFFTWAEDALGQQVEQYAQGTVNYKLGVLAFVLLQLFLVATATIAFSKIGS